MIYFVGPVIRIKSKKIITRIILKLLNFLIPFSNPLYTLIETINMHKISIKKSKNKVWFRLNILDIAADIRGNDSAKPTPAPVSIAPIKNTSKTTLNMPDCFDNNIPEKVRGVLEFFISEKTNATVGSMYKAQPVNIQ